MGVFTDLLEQLETDIAAVHGAARPIVWRYDPSLPAASRWTADVESVRGRPLATATGASGEDPLRRLAESYARAAHTEREKHATKP